MPSALAAVFNAAADTCLIIVDLVLLTYTAQHHCNCTSLSAQVKQRILHHTKILLTLQESRSKLSLAMNITDPESVVMPDVINAAAATSATAPI